jgi:hypothetical protein
VSSNLSHARREKVFNEGRRSAREEHAENPYDNAKLRQLWELDRTQQRSGAIEAPIPPLAHAETRARRIPSAPSRPATCVGRRRRAGEVRGRAEDHAVNDARVRHQPHRPKHVRRRDVCVSRDVLVLG